MSQPNEVAFNAVETNVTVVTSAETAIVTSERVAVPHQSARVLIIALVRLTTGAGTSAVGISIRRGTGISGTLVGEANATSLGAAAGGTELLMGMVMDEVRDVADVQYTATVSQTGASGNGTALEGAILAIVS